MTKSILVISFFILLITSAQAQIFRLNYNSSQIDSTFRSAFEAEITRIENDINKNLPSNTNMDRFMVGMANSSVYAGKGLSTDYVTDFSIFTIGLGVGAAADLEKDTTTKSDVSGIGFQGALQFGVNMSIMPVEKIGKVEMDRLNIMFSFMNNSILELGKVNEKLAKDGIDLNIKSFGVMATYKLKDGKGSRAAGWGGVKLHTGYQYNLIDFNFSKQLDETFDNPTDGADVQITGKPGAGLEVATHSIPLEISTDVRFLYILSLYGGLGVDYSWGEAKAKVNSNVNAINMNCGSAACTGPGNSVQIQPIGNINGSGKADAFGSRAFLGLQVNVPFVRIYVQGNKNLSNDMVSGAAGVRLAF